MNKSSAHRLYTNQDMNNPEMCWNCRNVECAKDNDKEDSCVAWVWEKRIMDHSECEEAGIAYSPRTCPKCGQQFCFNCCENTNVHEGGKHESDFMYCSKCGHDYYAEVVK